MIQTYNYSGQRQIDAKAQFIRFERDLSGAADPQIRVVVDGNDLGVWRPGDAVELPREVSRIEITPVTSTAGELRVGSGRFVTSRMAMSGNVNVQESIARTPRCAPTCSQLTVTNASVEVLPAANDRQYLLIQNNHASAIVYVRFGAAATAPTSLRINPGGYWEWDSNVPINSVNVLGDIASNPDCVLIVGQAGPVTPLDNETLLEL